MTTIEARTPVEAATATFAMLRERDLSRPEQIWAADAVDHFLAVGSYRGRGAIAGYFRDLFSAFPDLVIETERICESGADLAVVQWHATGTFTGTAFLGVRATGARLDLRGVDVIEFRDGLVLENTIYYDGATFARQIGVLPPEGSFADRAAIHVANLRTRARGLLRGCR